MKINRVLDYYYRAYNRAAAGREQGRGMINAGKILMKAGERPVAYSRLKKIALRALCGPFYWPNTFPTGVDEGVAVMLYSLVRLMRPAIALEIGTAKGNSTIAIAQALQDNRCGLLHTIDPEEQDIVHIAIKKAGLASRIQYHIDYSTTCIPRLGLSCIDFAFIDGSHAYTDVRNDFSIVHTVTKSGGIIVFHDAHLFEGVRAVVREAEVHGLLKVVSLPTLIGVDAHGGAVSVSGAHDFFNPVGLAICQKI